MPNIISKLKKSGLVGRGGGCFPTGVKWQMVKKARGDAKYVVCNASEGEPGIKKDLYIIEHHTREMVDGMKIAMDYLGAAGGYVYLNPAYYRRKKLRARLKRVIRGTGIELIPKPGEAGYIGGEETSVLNGIEGKRIGPRLRPPYPPTSGLWNQPTLVNNVETFYDVSLIMNDEYRRERFYTINGDCMWTGVYRYPEDRTVSRILKDTGNYPDFDFFVQVGGDASGRVLNSRQLNVPVSGSGSITVYSVIKYDPMELIRGWAGFFYRESCGQCTPCREGAYRLHMLLNEDKVDWQMTAALMDNLAETSFCGLGCAAPIAIRSFVDNVLAKKSGDKFKLPPAARRSICNCFS